MIVPKESMFSSSIFMLQEADKYLQMCYNVGLIEKKPTFENVSYETIRELQKDDQNPDKKIEIDDVYDIFVKETTSQTNAL